MSEEESSQLADGELSQWLAELEHPVHARRIDLALCQYCLMRQHYVMGSYRPYLTGSLGCELEAIIREVLGIEQCYGRYDYTDELMAPRYGSNTGSICGDANKLLNYHMLLAEISGTSNYLGLLAEARRRLGWRCPYGLYNCRFGGAGRLCYNAEAAGGRSGDAVVVPAAGVLAPAVQDIYPLAHHVARIVALGRTRGSSADGLYNQGEPRGLIGYQADRVSDGGSDDFVAIEVGDVGQPEQQDAYPSQPERTSDDRGELVERVLQSMFCGVVPACATSHTLFKDGPDYVRFTIFSGLMFIAAVTYTGMFCRSRGKSSLRIAVCATVALTTFAVALQLSATDHIVVAAAMGVLTSLIMSTAI